MMSPSDLERHRREQERATSIYYRAIEKTDKYAPCPCGSGKKFKWCCYREGHKSP